MPKTPEPANLTDEQKTYRHLDRASWLIAAAEREIRNAGRSADDEKAERFFDALSKTATGLYDALVGLTNDAREDAGLVRNSSRDQEITKGNDDCVR